MFWLKNLKFGLGYVVYYNKLYICYFMVIKFRKFDWGVVFYVFVVCCFWVVIIVKLVSGVKNLMMMFYGVVM